MGAFPVGSAWETTEAVQCGDASLLLVSGLVFFGRPRPWRMGVTSVKERPGPVWPAFQKPLITVSDIEGLPSAVRAQWPDVSVLHADTITRASKYPTFVTRHDPKTPATVDGFVLLESIASRTHLIRALRNLVREGLSVTADALAAVADFVSTHSKARFEIKHSPTRGLCIRAIAGHTAVLDMPHQGEMRPSGVV